MPISHLFPFSILLAFSTLTIASSSSSSSTEAFVFSGCSPVRFVPGSAYETNVNTLLTSLVNSAMLSNYNNFTMQGSNPQDTLYGLFQCRGDISNTECSLCVAQAVSQLSTLCLHACSGALQLDRCFVKYDNTQFLGVEDKTQMLRKCGPLTGVTSDVLTCRDAVLTNLGALDGAFRVTTSCGDVQGVAQCVGDLSASECQDCISDAIQQLRIECGVGAWGQMYLVKCYARHLESGSHSPTENDDRNRNCDRNRNRNCDRNWNRNCHRNRIFEEIEKTGAVAGLTGLGAVVVLIIVFIRKQKGVGNKENPKEYPPINVTLSVVLVVPVKYKPPPTPPPLPPPPPPPLPLPPLPCRPSCPGCYLEGPGFCCKEGL